jgi:putative transposase
VARVHAANVREGTAARQVLERLFTLRAGIKRIRAESADQGAALLDWVSQQFACALSIERKHRGKRGFHVLARRWVVERSFAWLVRSRRLRKDYERKPSSSEAQVYLASGRLL